VELVTDRVTLVTATGLPLLSLGFHVATGLVAFAAGFIALGVRKGGKWHRKSGTVFGYAMIATGLTASGIAAYEGKPTVIGGALTAYLVFTGWSTVKPFAGAGRGVATALAALAFALAAVEYAFAFSAFGRPGNHIDGVPAGMMFFLATIILLAAIGDVRMIRAGGIQGTRRLARHLWRMCFGLFIATGSFVAQLVMMQFMPGWMRSVPVILMLAAGPLVVLVYWMWRVRLRQNVRGLMTAKPTDAYRMTLKESAQ
jgi:uncharacterized membrane protein